MVAYGPWEQGENLSITLNGFAYKNIRRTMTSGGREAQYASGGDNASTLSNAATSERNRAAIPDWTADDYDGPSYGSGISTAVAIGPTANAPYPFTTGVSHSETGFMVRATGAMLYFESTYADSIPLPPGAVDVELESLSFVPLSATVTANVRDAGGGINGDAIPSTGLVMYYYIRPADTPVGSSGRRLFRHATRSDASQADYSLGFQVDQADLDSTYDGAIIWPEVDFGASPVWSVSSAGPLPRAGYWNISRSFGILAVAADWVIRPPRHRFVYATAPGLPPLRQSPRDDNLGTASAARIWPSSSQQNSPRRLWYF